MIMRWLWRARAAAPLVMIALMGAWVINLLPTPVAVAGAVVLLVVASGANPVWNRLRVHRAVEWHRLPGSRAHCRRRPTGSSRPSRPSNWGRYCTSDPRADDCYP